MLRDASERCTSRCLAGEPVSLSLVVDQIELRIAVPGNPDSPGWNIARATQSNEQRRQLLAVAGTVDEPSQRTFKRSIFILDFFPRCIVNCLDFFPIRFALSYFLSQCHNFWMCAFNERTRS